MQHNRNTIPESPVSQYCSGKNSHYLHISPTALFMWHPGSLPSSTWSVTGCTTGAPGASEDVFLTHHSPGHRENPSHTGKGSCLRITSSSPNPSPVCVAHAVDATCCWSRSLVSAGSRTLLLPCPLLIPLLCALCLHGCTPTSRHQSLHVSHVS